MSTLCVLTVHVLENGDSRKIDLYVHEYRAIFRKFEIEKQTTQTCINLAQMFSDATSHCSQSNVFFWTSEVS